MFSYIWYMIIWIPIYIYTYYIYIYIFIYMDVHICIDISDNISCTNISKGLPQNQILRSWRSKLQLTAPWRFASAKNRPIFRLQLLDNDQRFHMSSSLLVIQIHMIFLLHITYLLHRVQHLPCVWIISKLLLVFIYPHHCWCLTEMVLVHYSLQVTKLLLVGPSLTAFLVSCISMIAGIHTWMCFPATKWLWEHLETLCYIG